MSLNIEKYLPYLDDYDWPEKDKIEMIRSVSHMMEVAADRAFNLNQAPYNRGKPKESNLRNHKNLIDSKNISISSLQRKAANDDVMIEKGDRHAG